MKKNESLKRARVDAKLSQTELADRLGFKQAYISKLEGGESFSEEQAKRIADILNVSWKDILPPNQEIISYNIHNEDQITTGLRDLIRSKEEIINMLKDRIAEKDQLLRSKDEIIKLLKEQIAVKSSENDPNISEVIPGQLTTKHKH